MYLVPRPRPRRPLPRPLGTRRRHLADQASQGVHRLGCSGLGHGSAVTLSSVVAGPGFEPAMFSIAIVFFIILFPVLIPAAVAAIHAIAEAGQRRRERIANSLGDGVGSNGGQSVSHEHTRLAAVA